SALSCRRGGLLRRLGLGCSLAAFRGLDAKPLGEAFDATFSVYELLPAGEERMAVVANLEVQFRFGGSGLPRCAAGTARLDLVVLWMNPFLHSRLLDPYGKRSLYQ